MQRDRRYGAVTLSYISTLRSLLLLRQYLHSHPSTTLGAVLEREKGSFVEILYENLPILREEV